MEVAEPDVELYVSRRPESDSVKAFTIQNSPVKPQHETCATAYVQSFFNETAEFRLFSLPLEVRRNIYHYYFAPTLSRHESRYHLLQADKNCNIYCLTKCPTHILTVNHQLHDEAQEVLYGDTVWHISFNSFAPGTDHNNVSDASLQAFGSRPEFQFIRNVTVGVMFYPVMKAIHRKAERRSRLRVNRSLLRIIRRTLLNASNLRTVKLLWHDVIERRNWEKKQGCLNPLAKLPEKVKCTIFLGPEAVAVHSPQLVTNGRRELSDQEHAAKADLNRYLNTIRQQYQASSGR